MAAQPPAPDIELLANRAFAFYPPILNIEHNEWRFLKDTWSEILVANTKSGIEVWVPRRVLGAISKVDEPVVIVGLHKELEYKAGTVWPHERRVLEMPRMPGDPAPAAGSAAAPPSSRTRYASSTESRIGRLIAYSLGGLLAACLLVFGVLRLGSMRPVHFTAADQDFLSLSRYDDYFAVVRKLGPPGEDRWRSETGALQYRVLWYPRRSYYIVLLGPDRNDAHYIGALDRNWRVIHYVDLPGHGDTASMLRALPRF
ncbi:MAG: hypothetical protein ACM336_19545 [Acidobacteriota bacterium]